MSLFIQERLTLLPPGDRPINTLLRPAMVKEACTPACPTRETIRNITVSISDDQRAHPTVWFSSLREK
jgi:hypothetical protein